MKIGLVCPYAFDVPGGVQFHIRDLAKELRRRGHEVAILGPAAGETGIENFTSAGGTVPVNFNGSVARLCFGPVAWRRTRAWLADGKFDVVHVHEPFTPSVSMMALSAAECPTVATFHMASDFQWAYVAAVPLVSRLSEKISAPIAVSAEARRTLVTHQGGDAVIIPNGVYVKSFEVDPRPDWQTTGPDAPVFAFLGRLDEERKGLSVLAGAIDPVLERFPGARFLIAGRGDGEVARSLSRKGDNVTLLGEISDEDKARLLAGATAYVAPQTGGESFGIVLVEAMAAGTLVVASDIPAFGAVLEQGEAGRLFSVGDSVALAATLIDVAEHPDASAALAAHGHEVAWRYDWTQVTDEILAVYETVTASAAMPVSGDTLGVAGKFLSRGTNSE